MPVKGIYCKRDRERNTIRLKKYLKIIWLLYSQIWNLLGNLCDFICFSFGSTNENSSSYHNLTHKRIAHTQAEDKTSDQNSFKFVFFRDRNILFQHIVEYFAPNTHSSLGWEQERLIFRKEPKVESTTMDVRAERISWFEYWLLWRHFPQQPYLNPDCFSFYCT